MADIKVSAMSLVTPTLDDLLYLVDDPGGTPVSKACTVASLGLNHAPVTAPVDGDFAWINQGGASITATGSRLFLRGPAGTGVNLRIRKKAAPSTPYTITAGFLPAALAFTTQSMGLCFRQSSDGKLATFTLTCTTGAYQFQPLKYTSATVFSAAYTGARSFFTPGLGMLWFRIADNGTNRILSYSADGDNFIAFHTIGRTDFLTADEVGWYVDEETNVYDCGMTLVSWKQE